MRISDWSSDVCSSDLLGPAGTFTEQAARSLAPKLVPSIAPAQATGDQAPSVALEPCSTVTVALDLVRSGEVAGAVVPIENSVEGSVPVTLDELATGDPLVIAAEAPVPIQFSLIALPGTTRSEERRVGKECVRTC